MKRISNTSSFAAGLSGISCKKPKQKLVAKCIKPIKSNFIRQSLLTIN